ncbi:hypothetical protein L873DRAFT_1848694 [Choiromyces venosus 120613-1]|uniref:Uncharacterized protein n=1 Tax=Choiromyces venosus 120613-1 TaxID=1336337 RepID=A0A3N4J2D3_9PEZI|nr:hypothetical protein L873DRAFT_1848694 [Choiromyces venosus 120613-1]
MWGWGDGFCPSASGMPDVICACPDERCMGRRILTGIWHYERRVRLVHQAHGRQPNLFADDVAAMEYNQRVTPAFYQKAFSFYNYMAGRRSAYLKEMSEKMQYFCGMKTDGFTYASRPPEDNSDMMNYITNRWKTNNSIQRGVMVDNIFMAWGLGAALLFPTDYSKLPIALFERRSTKLSEVRYLIDHLRQVFPDWTQRCKEMEQYAEQIWKYAHLPNEEEFPLLDWEEDIQ